jgi:HEAT repeat protein
MSEGTMKRRPLLWLGILLAMGLVFALAFPTSHYVLIGLLHNQAFYDGKPTDYWVSALKKRGYFGSKGPPRDVGNVLAKAGAAAVPVLVDMLQEEDDDVRFQALLALLAMKPGEAAAAAPALERAMINEKTNFPGLACLALVKANEDAAIRAFIGMLERGDKSRGLAATALGDLGPRARAAVGALRVALDDGDVWVRVRAAEALWHIERRVDTKLLLTLAQGEESGFRGRLQVSMPVWKQLGPEAQAAVPGLLQTLQSPDETIRLSATIALGHMGQRMLAKEAVWALAARLKDGLFPVRRGAAWALGKMGPKAAEAVPALIEALQDIDTATRLEAASSLGDIGPVASTAAPHLGRAVKDAEPPLCTTAAYALGRLGPAAKAAVPDLIEALKHKDEFTRSNAAEALGRIGPVASTAIPGLSAALQDKSFHVRRSAAYALGRIALAQTPIP